MRYRSSGNRERELRAFADCAFHPQPAAVRFDDVFGDGKAQAGAARFARTGRIHAIEALENSFLIGERNSDAGVATVITASRSFASAVTRMLAALGRVLDGVVEQILQDVAQEARIAADGREFRAALQFPG